MYTEIKNSIIAQLKAAYPAFEVYAEEIKKTDEDENTPELIDFFFVDIIPTGLTPFSADMNNHGYSIAISCRTGSGKNREYAAIAERLDGLFNPVMSFEDRHITVNNTTWNITDRMLSYVISFGFYDGTAQTDNAQIMGDLIIRKD